MFNISEVENDLFLRNDQLESFELKGGLTVSDFLILMRFFSYLNYIITRALKNDYNEDKYSFLAKNSRVQTFRIEDLNVIDTT